MASDDRMHDEIDALRQANRVAAEHRDERPDPRVRAAVLAAAARAVDARPANVPTPGQPSGRARTRRWPLSAAALLLVSVLAGMVGTRALRDAPERVTNVAVLAPTAVPNPAPQPKAEAPAAGPVTAPVRATDPAQAPAPVPAPRAASTPQTPLPHRPPSVAPPTAEVQRAERSSTVARAAQDEAAAATVERRAEAPAPAVPRSPAPATFGRQSAVAPEAEPDALARADAARNRRAVEPLSAEAWVERIVRLRADGNDGEADRELEALRVRYPGFAVPAGALRATGTR